MGKHFLNLLDKNFAQNHCLHEIFNRSRVKISYSCTKSMKTIINNHNKNTLERSRQNYKEKQYFGIAEESFKGRLYNHELSFRNEFYKNNAELFKELCQIKMKNYTRKITWRIIRKCITYNNSRMFYLCLNEKLDIALNKEKTYKIRKRNSFPNAVIKIS